MCNILTKCWTCFAWDDNFEILYRDLPEITGFIQAGNTFGTKLRSVIQYSE